MVYFQAGKESTLKLKTFFCVIFHYLKILFIGIVDGSPSKPALRQDAGYMVVKTYLDIWGLLGSI